MDFVPDWASCRVTCGHSFVKSFVKSSTGPESRRSGWVAVILEAGRLSSAWWCGPLAHWGLLKPLLQSRHSHFFLSWAKISNTDLMRTLAVLATLNVGLLNLESCAPISGKVADSQNHIIRGSGWAHCTFHLNKGCSFRLILTFVAGTYCPCSRQYDVDPVLVEK